MSYKIPYFAYGKQANKLNYKPFKLGGFYGKLNEVLSLDGNVSTEYFDSEWCPMLWRPQTRHPPDDDIYNGGTSFDGW